MSYAGSFGLGGAAVGGLIGTAVPVDRWSRLDLPEERGFAEPQRDSHLGTILLLTGSLLLIAAGS